MDLKMSNGDRDKDLVKKIITAYSYVAVWIALSGTVIM